MRFNRLAAPLALTLAVGCNGGGAETAPATTADTAVISVEGQTGSLDFDTCLTLAGINVILGDQGSSPLSISGDEKGITGSINVTPDDLRRAADSLESNLGSADRTKRPGIEAQQAQQAIRDALPATNELMRSIPPSPEFDEADASAIEHLDTARDRVDEAIIAGCAITVGGDNLTLN